MGRPDQTRAQLRDQLSDMGWFADGRHNHDVCPTCLDANPQFRVVRCPGCHREFSVPSF